MTQTFRELIGVVARLRSPEGCPWDVKQTHESLKPFLLEEAYEVLDALDGSKPRHLCEELGDLLLQIGLHAQIEAEAQTFDMEDVIAELTQKLIRRHPHVFTATSGETPRLDPEEVVQQWEEIKQAEYAAKGKTRQLLDGIPASLPALETTRQLQVKASRAGHDTWLHADADTDPAAGQLAEDRLGRQLWDLVSQARQRDLNPEDALRKCNTLFRAQVEAAVASQANRTAETRLPKRKRDGETGV